MREGERVAGHIPSYKKYSIVLVANQYDMTVTGNGFFSGHEQSLGSSLSINPHHLSPNKACALSLTLPLSLALPLSFCYVFVITFLYIGILMIQTPLFTHLYLFLSQLITVL